MPGGCHTHRVLWVLTWGRRRRPRARHRSCMRSALCRSVARSRVSAGVGRSSRGAPSHRLLLLGGEGEAGRGSLLCSPHAPSPAPTPLQQAQRWLLWVPVPGRGLGLGAGGLSPPRGPWSSGLGGGGSVVVLERGGFCLVSVRQGDSPGTGTPGTGTHGTRTCESPGTGIQGTGTAGTGTHGTGTLGTGTPPGTGTPGTGTTESFRMRILGTGTPGTGTYGTGALRTGKCRSPVAGTLGTEAVGTPGTGTLGCLGLECMGQRHWDLWDRETWD